MIRRCLILFLSLMVVCASCKSTKAAAESGSAEKETAQEAPAENESPKESAPSEAEGGASAGTAAADAGVAAAAGTGAVAAAGAIAEEPPLSEEEQEEREQIRKELEAQKKADEKKRKREQTDKYLGVVYTPERSCELKSGKVRVVLTGNTGSFNIYAIDAKNREIPVLAEADGFRSTYFSVLVGKDEYRLNREARVSSQVRKRDEGAQIAYRLEKDLQIILDFSTLASVAGEADDVVKVTVYTTNLTKNRQVLALKAVFDTVLGENLDYHFVTATGKKIPAERQIANFDKDTYFISTNEKVTAQFLLAGKSIPEPQVVSFANKDIIANSMWTPVVREERGFSTALSYSNSAMCVNWPYYSVESGETTSFTFYICIATEGDAPKGEQFLASLTDDAKTVETFAGANNLVVRKPDVDFVVAPITEYQLDPEYIQKLIDRINSLNSDPNLVDRTEVRQLNAELDAILDKLRRMH